MNTKLFVLALLSLVLTSASAFAYTSGQADPANGIYDQEFKVVKKSETAGVSDAVSKGDILLLDTANNNDGYTVTRVGARNVATTARIACVASKAIATGNTGLNRCISKGYVDFLKYDTANGAISIGQKLCVNSVGAAVACAACDNLGGANDCRFGTATDNSPIISLSSKPSGSGTDLKALIKAQ